MLPHTWLDLTEVGGATALGMVNPNSRTNALQSFREVIGRVPQGRSLLFMLGEVDCGFLIWHRAARLGSSSQQFEESLHNYFGFLNSLLSEGRRSLVVSIVPPPTILDGQTWGEVANARSAVAASLADRAA